jgi:hypothetical protein
MIKASGNKNIFSFLNVQPMKLIILALFTFVGSAGIYLYHHLLEGPIHCLIPQDYHGDIIIIYDQPQGAAEEYNGNSRVYRIPSNGILFTRFSAEINTGNQEYFYITTGGAQKKIMPVSTEEFNEPWSYIKNPKEPSRTQTRIIDGGAIWTSISAHHKYDYQHAFVGSYKQFTSYHGYRLSHIDSLVESFTPAGK